MDEPIVYTLYVSYDPLALPGCEWWATVVDTDGADVAGLLCTALKADAHSALVEIADRLTAFTTGACAQP